MFVKVISLSLLFIAEMIKVGITTKVISMSSTVCGLATDRKDMLYIWNYIPVKISC